MSSLPTCTSETTSAIVSVGLKQGETTNELDSSSQQRRLQRKQLRRYADSEEEHDSSDDENGIDKGKKENSNNNLQNEEMDRSDVETMQDIEGKEENENNVEIKSKLTSGDKPSSTLETTTATTSKRLITAADALSEVANQNLNGELSLLQNYENTGAMNEVFGSQSLLSQELFQNNSLSQQSLPWLYNREEGMTASSKLVVGVNSSSCKISSDDKNEIQSSHDQSTDTTSKLHGNEETLSIHNSLTSLPAPESQVMNDTEQSNITFSHGSSISGYDITVGVVQKPNDVSESKVKEEDDEMISPVPPLPILPAKDGIQILQDPISKQILQEQHSTNTDVTSDTVSNQVSDGYESINKKRAAPTTQDSSAVLEQPPNKVHRETITVHVKPVETASGYIQTNGTLYSYKKTKAERKRIEENTNYTAKRAAALVEQLRVNKKVEKQLLLSMALTRENPRTAPASYPSKGTVITNGFFWGQFPPLEKVLRDHMEEYYELSIEKCQSRTQQAFNNDLVCLVKEEAAKFEWIFDSTSFDDKKLRDRVRCFFKTHIQNAKKRLKTMIRNPLKRANAKALAAHLDLIEKCDLIDKMKERKECDNMDGEMQVVTIKPNVPFDENNSRSIFDSDAHDAAQVLALGFNRLSQDDHVMETQLSEQQTFL